MACGSGGPRRVPIAQETTKIAQVLQEYLLQEPLPFDMGGLQPPSPFTSSERPWTHLLLWFHLQVHTRGQGAEGPSCYPITSILASFQISPKNLPQTIIFCVQVPLPEQVDC